MTFEVRLNDQTRLQLGEETRFLHLKSEGNWNIIQQKRFTNNLKSYVSSFQLERLLMEVPLLNATSNIQLNSLFSSVSIPKKKIRVALVIDQIEGAENLTELKLILGDYINSFEFKILNSSDSAAKWLTNNFNT